LQSIYRDLVAEASTAYVLKRTLFKSWLEQVDAHLLELESNFKLGMSGEQLIVVSPTVALSSSVLLRHYPKRSSDVPSHLQALAEEVYLLFSEELTGPVNAFVFLHDLEAILLLQMSHLRA